MAKLLDKHTTPRLTIELVELSTFSYDVVIIEPEKAILKAVMWLNFSRETSARAFFDAIKHAREIMVL